MSRRKTIEYAIEDGSNHVISRCGDRIYYPVLNFENMKSENGYDFGYIYEEGSCYDLVHFGELKWTRKIPNRIKNFHRKYWGFKPLKGKNRWE